MKTSSGPFLPARGVRATLIFVLSLAVIAGPFLATALAEESDRSSSKSYTVEAEEQTLAPLANQNDDTLLDAYVEKRLSEALPDGAVLFTAQQELADKLTGNNSVIYDRLESMVMEVAAGELSSTIFTVSAQDVLGKTEFTAEELGVQTVVSNGDISEEAQAAISELLAMDTRSIVNTLLAEHPYDLYWYDKTASTSFYGPFYGVSGYGNSYTFTIEGDYTFKFPVADDYAAGTYKVDTSTGTRVSKAVRTAESIAAAGAGKSSYERLHGYKKAICDRVSYDQHSVDTDAAFGDPWQLISVFDDDKSTNVVCEGYSKAFKYLCDLSGSKSAKCVTTTGYMQGGRGAGAHMWNVVTMPDGKNYLVDVTNCDEGSVGADDQLFLVGYSSGSVSDGYRFGVESGSVFYAYDSDTVNLYGVDDITISDEDYDPNYPESGFEPVEPTYEDGWVSLPGGKKGYAKGGKLVTGWMDLGGSKYWFGADGAMATGWTDVAVGGNTMHYYFNPASGNMARGTWMDVDGSKYYFRESGNMATGWTDVDGSKYYLDAEGHMVTGWLELGGVKYYLRPSGTMATGFETVGGKQHLFRATGTMVTGWGDWGGKKYYAEADGTLVKGTWKEIGSGRFYFRPSGALATGWADIGGVKYYFRPSGNMATEWADVDGSKFYFDGDGKMLTGWQQIGGRTYYFRASGAMQTGEATIGGEAYVFGDNGVLQSGVVPAQSKGEGVGETQVSEVPDELAGTAQFDSDVVVELGESA